MSESLDGYVTRVADVAIANAGDLTKRFAREAGLPAPWTDQQRAEMMTAFAFMNLGLAGDVWSELGNERLRKSLLDRTKVFLATRLATRLTTNRHSQDITALTRRLVDREIPAYLSGFHERVEELEAAGDGRPAFLFCCEWLGDRLELPDEVMGRAVPATMEAVGDPSAVEEIAARVGEYDFPDARRSWWARLRGGD